MYHHLLILKKKCKIRKSIFVIVCCISWAIQQLKPHEIYVRQLVKICGVCSVARMRALSKQRVSGKQRRARAQNERECVFKLRFCIFGLMQVQLHKSASCGPVSAQQIVGTFNFKQNPAATSIPLKSQTKVVDNQDLINAQQQKL